MGSEGLFRATLASSHISSLGRSPSQMIFMDLALSQLPSPNSCHVTDRVAQPGR